MWDKGEPLTWGLVVVGLVTGIAGVLNLRSARHLKRDKALTEGCRLLAAHVDKRCDNIALTDVEVIVWLVAGPPGGKYLARAQDFVLGERSQGGAVTWIRGKGVIGRCWEENAPLSVNLEKDFYPRATQRRAFEALPERDRFGLTWQERKATRRYESIWAAPLRSRHQVNASVVGIVCVGLRRKPEVSGANRARQLESALMVRTEDGEKHLTMEADAVLDKCQRALHGVE